MNLSKKWDLGIDPDVLKSLRKTPRFDAERILQIIRSLPYDPYFGDVKKMKGEENVWRRRIGNYRIFYKLKNLEMVILVFRLERRTSSTYAKR